jgi:hypothetical protein
MAWRIWDWCNSNSKVCDSHFNVLTTTTTTSTSITTTTNAAGDTVTSVSSAVTDYSSGTVTTCTTEVTYTNKVARIGEGIVQNVPIDFSDFALRGQYKMFWPVKEVLKATCKYPGHKLFKDTDDIPVYECSCGIYALKQPNFSVTYIHDRPILGVVELWGKIIVAEYGYRAEYAKIRALVDAPAEAGAKYQVPNLPSIGYARKEFFS